jgi:protein-S-isoprenylcysteine O-methyltransferase Ste14
MSLFPPLSLDWFNGWIPVVIFYASYLILLKVFPKTTVERLYDNTGWTDDQARAARIGLPFALVALILILFSPLKINRPVFWIGLALALLGQIGFMSALFTFNTTPLGVPVTGGLYRISRNPQWVAFAVIMIGFSLMVGSWVVLALLMVRVAMNHFRILGEERALESQYGASYLEYKKTVPRYLIFF